jgi:predicted nucleic acid-binding protein
MADAASGEALVRVAAEKNVAAFSIGRSVGLISLLCLFVFAAYVASQLRRYRGDHDPLPYVALGAGAMAAVLAMTGATAQFALVRRAADGMDPVLAQPQLIDLEVASVLRRQVAAGRVDPRRASLAVTDLVDLPMRRAPQAALLHRCWELRQTLTIYDAAYVALAEALGCSLLTADRGLARAVGPQCRVDLLT